MEICEIIKLLDQAAPLELSYAAQRGGAYDNSGLIVDCGGQTQSVVCALDLTDAVVDYAVSVGAKLIVTHHPAIYRPIKNITNGKFVKAIANGISIYSAHLNLDAAVGGVEDGLASTLEQGSSEICELITEERGFGRKTDIQPQPFEKVVNRVIEVLNAKNYMVFGDKNTTVSRVGTFCGAGFSEKTLSLIGDCQMIISADIAHHVLLAALEQGKCVLQLTHYSSEMTAMKKFTTDFFEKIKLKSYFYVDERF